MYEIVIIITALMLSSVNGVTTDTPTPTIDCWGEGPPCDIPGCMLHESGEGCMPAPELDCWCSTVTASTPTSSSGLSYGDCVCNRDYGLMELRLEYMGTLNAKQIDIHHDGYNSEIICSYNDRIPGDVIICNVNETTNGRIPKLAKNTVIKIIHDDDSECLTQFHTSCSSDIVGEYSENCAELFCTGWRDADPNTDSCTDGTEPCSCDDTTTTAPTTTTAHTTTMEPGDCYCDNVDHNATNPNTGGAGWGDCECSGGMIELRWKYIGNGSVDMDVYYGNNAVCQFNDVKEQQEVTCNIRDYNGAGGPFDKFEKNTYFELVHSDGTICYGEYHTSCSRDIVGFHATNDECMELICTGWKDGDDTHIDCDDGYDPCLCPTDEPTTTITETQETEERPPPDHRSTTASNPNGTPQSTQHTATTTSHGATTAAETTRAGTTAAETYDVETSAADTTAAKTSAADTTSRLITTAGDTHSNPVNNVQQQSSTSNPTESSNDNGSSNNDPHHSSIGNMLKLKIPSLCIFLFGYLMYSQC